MTNGEIFMAIREGSECAFSSRLPRGDRKKERVREGTDEEGRTAKVWERRKDLVAHYKNAERGFGTSGCTPMRHLLRAQYFLLEAIEQHSHKSKREPRLAEEKRCLPCWLSLMQQNLHIDAMHHGLSIVSHHAAAWVRGPPIKIRSVARNQSL